MNPLLLLLLGLGGFMSAMGSSSASDEEDSIDAAAQNDDTDDQPDTPDEAPSAPVQDQPQEEVPALQLTWVIYDMAAMAVVDTVTSGETLDLGTVLTDDFTVAVESTGPDVGSMVLEYDGQTWLQNDDPYTLKPSWVDLSDGSFEVDVTVYSGANGTGSVLGTDTVSFSTTSQIPDIIVEEEELNIEEPVEEPAEEPADEPAEAPAEEPAEAPAEEPADEPVEAPAEEPAETDEQAQTLALTAVIWDMSSNSLVDAVDDGEAVDLGVADTTDYTVAFESGDNAAVGSMILTYNDQTWLQNDYPFTLKPDWVDLSEGSFEVGVSAYSGPNGTGDLLGTTSVSFSTTSEMPEVIVIEEDVVIGEDIVIEEDDDASADDPVDETPAAAPVAVGTPEAPDQSGDAGAGADTDPIDIVGTVEVMEGRVATLAPGQDNVVGLRITDGVDHGNVTVNPDGTFALVMTDSTFTGNQNFSYEATYANGSTSNHTVNLKVVNGVQAEGWGTGEDHYMLATDENDDIVVEHGDEHTSVYITSAAKGLSRAEIANMEGINVNQVTGSWLANSDYGQSEALALDEDAGMLLWNEVTPRGSTTSNWLLLERGETYDNLGNVLNSNVNGESELHPLHIGAWGDGDRPVITENFFQIGDLNSNIVIQGIAFDDGLRFFKYSENVIFDDISVTGSEMAVQNSNSVTIRNSDFMNIYPEVSTYAGNEWNTHGDREQGLYVGKLEGLLLEGNFFDHNGFAPDYLDSASTAGGIPPSQWSHNIYIANDVFDITLRDSIMMRGASFGAQVRTGGFIEDNLFLDNNAQLQTMGGDYKGAGYVGQYSLISDNVITSSSYKEPDTPIGAVSLGLADDALLSSTVDNIVAHLADPNNPDELDYKYWANSSYRSDGAYYDDTIVYNWIGSAYYDDPSRFGEVDFNTEGLDTNVLDQTTIQLYAEQLLGQSGATIDDLGQFLQAQADDGHDLSDISSEDIIAYFQQGFGIYEEDRTVAEVARFVPNDLAEGVRWDNRLNWTTEDLPGTVAGDSVELGGNHVVYADTTTIDTLELGHSGELNIYGGRLNAEGGIIGDGTGLVEITGAGQLWTDGAAADGLEIEIDSGRFVNTGAMVGADLDATGGQTVLATGGAIYGVEDGDTLSVTGDQKIGFDDDDGGVALLALEEGGTVHFDANKGKLATIEEFRTGAMGDAPDVRSGIDLGDGTLSIDLAGLNASNGEALMLLDADEIIGVFDDVDIAGLGSKNATITIDYVNDSVSLTLSNGNGNVLFETIGEQDDVSAGEQALWDALTAGQGVFDESPPEIPEDEEEYLEAS